MNRVGIGYDVHPFAEGRECYLGGVKIEYEKGLEGHSDADVLIHAIADALLGCIGEGDIGYHFPNNDPQWKDVRSTVFLEHIAKMYKERSVTINNVDATVIAEAPKILPHLENMRKTLSEPLGITTQQITVKATTNEKMGFIGRKEGVAAMAVASVEIDF
ncbi:MAG: 2-C-methyl-D-erythritol 2,4-cyclodiphosphate synthase [Verrucomicrobiota bacterium]